MRRIGEREKGEGEEEEEVNIKRVSKQVGKLWVWWWRVGRRMRRKGEKGRWIGRERKAARMTTVMMTMMRERAEVVQG